jgi:hypothetical protein
LVDDSDAGHFDTSGLEVRRKKTLAEVNVVAKIKHMTSLELLKMLVRLERTHQKLVKISDKE